MSNSEKKIDRKKRRPFVDPRQMTLDDFLTEVVNSMPDDLPERPTEESCYVRPQIQGIICEMMRLSKMSREQVADDMTALYKDGTKITKAMIDSWTKSEREDEKCRYIPFDFMYALERVCGSKALTDYMCKLHGGKFIDQKEDEILSLGQVQMLKVQLSLKEKELKRSLSK